MNQLVITANMNIDSNFRSRLKSLLGLYKNTICKTTGNVFSFSEWGMKEDMDKNLDKLLDLQLLSTYIIMLEWKTYEQNTFNLQMDDEGCPVITYPSLAVGLIEEEMDELQASDCCNSCEEQQKEYKDLVTCFCEHFHCKYHMNIEPFLRAMGITPVGEQPDGISYMIINEGTDCDNNIFEVNKP